MKINVNKKAVGGRIKQIRLNKGYTLEAFGKLFNAKKGNVQSWEKGNALPNKERIVNICKIADLTLNELLHGSVDEFITTNFENLILESEYPYPTSFDEWKISRRFKTDSKNFPIDVNDLSNLQRFFNSYVSEEVGYILNDVRIYCDYFLENKGKFENTYFEHMQSINLLDNTRNELERSFKLDLEKHYFYDIMDFLNYSTYDFNDKIKLYVKYYPLLKELYNKMRIKNLDKGTDIKENDFNELKKIVVNRLDEIEQNGKDKVATDLTTDIVDYYKGRNK